MLALNCGSILNRMHYPEFINLVQNHNFICLTETKTNDVDTIKIPGYIFKMKNRKQVTKYKSGGIAFGFKEELENFVHPIQTASELVFWVKISKTLFNTDEDLIFGNVYIPPESSEYSIDDPINELRQEYLELAKSHRYILLNGDFNSRTANDLDFYEVNANKNCPMDFNVIDRGNTLPDFNMLYKRDSKDVTKNTYGRQLLVFCRDNNLFILNGRVNGDKPGMLTCRQASVVDYFICSYELLPFIVDLNVIEFSGLFSDVHSPVVLNMLFQLDECETNDSIRDVNDTAKKIKKWDENKKNDFIENIDLDKVEHLLQSISEKSENETISLDEVNILVNSFNNIVIESAEIVFGTYFIGERKKSRRENDNKPFFNQECWEKRKALRIAKRRYRYNRNHIFKEQKTTAERNYKKAMNRALNAHRRNMSKKIDNLRKSNSKEFWNLLKTKQKRNNSDISIDVLYNFFKDLNSSDEEIDYDFLTNVQQEELNAIVNCDIKQEEIEKCIKELKNNKASGDDHIVNEYLKSTLHIFMPIYVKLFNIIFRSGNVPEIWLKGNILPFYKNKGDKKDPKNYRPITILSCLGKLFTSILNSRLSKFVEEYLILEENQFGFRKSYSTTDSIFVLHILFDLLRLKRKKLYCAFIDFAKAFDTVWRPGLWRKLLSNSINGNMLKCIVNMYSNIKSRIQNGTEFSDFFPCNIGVRQGENLSPLLFSLYLNDLDSFFEDKNVIGLTHISNEIEKELDCFMKIFTVLYADDTVLMAESKEDLQKQLDALYDYCEIWKLKVNIDKSKIVVFTKGRLPNSLSFKYNNVELEIVKTFNYLGVTFGRTGSFLQAKQANIKKATVAMFDLLKKAKLHNLSIECQLQLFDKTIQPILLYGCEVWGAGDVTSIERVHLKFCKMVLHLKASTPDYMVYGELGRYPLEISIKLRIINYWSKLLTGKPGKLPAILYRLCLRKTILYGQNIAWVDYVKSILDNCGMSFVWDTQNVINNNWLHNSVKQKLVDQFMQSWVSRVQNSPKAINYRIFKERFEFENYLKLLDCKKAIRFCRFRTTNHNLPIESGRWGNTDRNDRKCNLCNLNEVGDEFHYLFVCSAFQNERSNFLKQKIRTRPNILKMRDLFQTKNLSDLYKLCNFIHLIDKRIVSPG